MVPLPDPCRQRARSGGVGGRRSPRQQHPPPGGLISRISITTIDSERGPRSEIRLFDVVAVFFLSIVTAAIGIAIGSAIGGGESYAETIGSLLGLWAGLITGVVFVCRVRETGTLVDALGVRFRFPSDLRGILAGVGSQFLLLPIVYLLIEELMSRDLTEDLEAPAVDLTNDAHGVGFWLLAVLLVVGAPLVEEIFYRGMLLRSLKRHLPAPVAIVICGVIFGAAHFNLVTFPGLALFGVILAYLANRYGRLGPNIVAHASFNLVTVIALWHA